ncbi:MAG: FitA-like ribbon-helix-helix domain-containing protein [Chloroflexota bacterium]
MPELLIRDLPEALHYRLNMRAAQNRRSMSQEAIILLERALLENEVQRRDPPAPFQGQFAIDEEWLDDADR